jgi:hypothetical protein
MLLRRAVATLRAFSSALIQPTNEMNGNLRSEIITPFGYVVSNVKVM